MRTLKTSLFVQQSLLIAMAMGLVNCAGVGFGGASKQTESSSSAASSAVDPGKDPNGASGAINQPGSGDPTASGLPDVLPKVQFIGPPCIKGSDCLVEFRLQQAVARTTEFDWKTNDVLYKQAVPAGATYLYAKPNYHYIPTSGHVSFAPGETSKKVYIRNINPDNSEIVIGVNMSVCQYGGTLRNCSPDFF